MYIYIYIYKTIEYCFILQLSKYCKHGNKTGSLLNKSLISRSRDRSISFNWKNCLDTKGMKD